MAAIAHTKDEQQEPSDDTMDKNVPKDSSKPYTEREMNKLLLDHLSIEPAPKGLCVPRNMQCYSQGAPPPQRLTSFIPPPNFGQVTAQIYRSGFPESKHYNFLHLLDLDDVMILTPDSLPVEYRNSLATEGITWQQFEVKQNKTAICTTKEVIHAILEQVKAVTDSGGKMLLHCNGGKHRTGCVVGAIRKAQGWHIDEVLEEYEAYARTKARAFDKEFLRSLMPPTVEEGMPIRTLPQPRDPETATNGADTEMGDGGFEFDEEEDDDKENR
ncbi:Tyrosine phosphatase-like protein [Elsinoe fawcettii]|nr:Tyrosine phosphatase-like protein [Elsinoe fawcettii]